MDILNLSAEPQWKVRSWLPRELRAEEVVFFPDACPGDAPLPTGVAVRTMQPDWRRFAVGDCGCGMRLVRSRLAPGDLTQAAWNAIADSLRANRGGPGDLGGGNHFLVALAPRGGGRLHMLIHTGSRAESGRIDALVGAPAAFDAESGRVAQWAVRNRAAVHAAVERVLGPLDLVSDLAHNSHERLPDGGVIIRKGCVRAEPGDITVLPSHIAGDAALLRASFRVWESLRSVSRGTGRAMPRSEGELLAHSYDFAALRQRVLMPTGLDEASLRTESPYAYRDLDDCLALLDGFVEEVQRFAVVGCMGHL